MPIGVKWHKKDKSPAVVGGMKKAAKERDADMGSFMGDLNKGLSKKGLKTKTYIDSRGDMVLEITGTKKKGGKK